MIVLLYDLQQPALIMRTSTGVIYRNQTAGMLCDQREESGYLIPIPSYVTEGIETYLENADGLSEQQATEVEKLWRDSIEPQMFMSLERSLLSESQEAWLYVNVNYGDHLGPAVLTWCNSD